MSSTLTGNQMGPRQLELPPKISGGGFGRLVFYGVLGAVDAQPVGDFVMRAREGADPVGREELVFVEHELEDAA